MAGSVDDPNHLQGSKTETKTGVGYEGPARFRRQSPGTSRVRAPANDGHSTASRHDAVHRARLPAGGARRGRAQTPVDGWSGQVECVIASRGEGYQDDQTHTWMLSGAPGVRNDFRDYPATWTVSGSGRRTPISARASAAGVGDSWTYGGSNASASITLFVPAGTATIRIAAGQRAVTAKSGIKGTAASVPFATDVGEWRFQFIDVVSGVARATLSDSRTQTRSDMAGWRPPPGTTVTETCSWNLTRSGSGSAGGADAKGAAAGASKGGAGGAAGAGAPSASGASTKPAGGGARGRAAAAPPGGSGARGAVITEGAAPAGGAAGATSAGAPSPSGASTEPAGGGAPAGAASATGGTAAAATAKSGGAGAAAAGGATNNETPAGISGTALSPDLTRQYTAIGLTRPARYRCRRRDLGRRHGGSTRRCVGRRYPSPRRDVTARGCRALHVRHNR